MATPAKTEPLSTENDVHWHMITFFGQSVRIVIPFTWTLNEVMGLRLWVPIMQRNVCRVHKSPHRAVPRSPPVFKWEFLARLIQFCCVTFCTFLQLQYQGKILSLFKIWAERDGHYMSISLCYVMVTKLQQWEVIQYSVNKDTDGIRNQVTIPPWSDQLKFQLNWANFLVREGLHMTLF